MKLRQRRLWPGLWLLAALVLTAPAWAQNGFPGSDNSYNQPAQPGQPGGNEDLGDQAGSFKRPNPIQPGAAISVLVFPTGFASATPPGAGGQPAAAPATDEFGAEDGNGAPAPMPTAGLTEEQLRLRRLFLSSLKGGMGASGQYYLYTYSPQASLVKRARNDEILTEEQLKSLINSATGVVDPDRAREVALRLGMQGLLITTVEELKSDPAKHRTDVTISLRLIATTSGKTLRSAAVTGSAVGAENTPQQFVDERAMREAATRVLPELGVQLAPEATPETVPGKGKKKRGQRKKARQARKAAAKAKKKAKKAEKAKQKSRKDSAQPERAAAPGPPPAAPAAPQGGATPAPAGAGGSASAPAASAGVAASDYSKFQAPPAAGKAYGTSSTPSRAVPRRRKGGLRVPPWFGIAGFLSGVSFF